MAPGDVIQAKVRLDNEWAALNAFIFPQQACGTLPTLVPNDFADTGPAISDIGSAGGDFYDLLIDPGFTPPVGAYIAIQQPGSIVYFGQYVEPNRIRIYSPGTFPNDLSFGTFSWTADIKSSTNFSIDRVGVTYLGRLAPPGSKRPSTRDVPWVTYLRRFDLLEPTTSGNEFRNPFEKPLHVQRFTFNTTSRFVTVPTAPPLTAPSAEFTLQTLSLPSFGSTSEFYPAIGIDDSYGYTVIPTYTSVPLVGEGLTRAMTFGTTLDKREAYTVKLRPSAGFQPLSLVVGMVGHRSER
jgi:hypothetical protein